MSLSAWIPGGANTGPFKFKTRRSAPPSDADIQGLSDDELIRRIRGRSGQLTQMLRTLPEGAVAARFRHRIAVEMAGIYQQFPEWQEDVSPAALENLRRLIDERIQSEGRRQ